MGDIVFPQKSNFSAQMRGCSPYLLFDTLLGALGVQAGLSRIVNAGAGRTPVDELSMWDLKAMLDDLGVRCEGMSVPAENIDLLPIPAMAQIIHSKGPEFVVLLEASREAATFFSCESGLETCDSESFLRRWCGPVLVPREVRAISEDESLRTATEEESQRNEFLSSVRTVDDFLTPQECAELIAVSSRHWEPSRVGARHSYGRVSSYRTSRSAELGETEHRELNERIAHRAGEIVPGILAEHVEKLQCVSYAEHQEFKPHYDIDNTGDNRHRLWTVLVYLNDGFEGGETCFPLVDLKVRPKAGMALVFANRLASGAMNAFALHAGLPVTSGAKYACNIWISGPAVANAGPAEHATHELVGEHA
ncbi:MAG TPA: 2OG-Fe(II) oxygenase [Xanthomonadaceae bacterium]|jgi:predicted 2-oxoglutarate/Fe(II)-dependent dioxygenase YbiX